MPGAGRTTPVRPRVAFGVRIPENRSSGEAHPIKQMTARPDRRSVSAVSATAATFSTAPGDVTSSDRSQPGAPATRARVARDARRSVLASQPQSGGRREVTPTSITVAASKPRRSGANFATAAAPSRGFRELQKSEQQLKEENERLVASASKTTNKLRTLKQDRDDLRATVERLEQELVNRNSIVETELEQLKKEFATRSADEAEETRRLRQNLDERESELEAQLEAAKARNETLERFVEKLGINAVTLDSFAASGKENEAVAELEENVRNIAANLKTRHPTVKENLARAKKLLTTV